MKMAAKPKYREMLLNTLMAVSLLSTCCESVIDLTAGGASAGGAASSSAPPPSPTTRPIPTTVTAPVRGSIAGTLPPVNPTATPAPSSAANDIPSASNGVGMAPPSKSSSPFTPATALPAVPNTVNQTQQQMPTQSVAAMPTTTSVTTTASPSQGTAMAPSQTSTSQMPSQTGVSPNARSIRWCVTSIKEADFCEQLVPYLQAVDYGYNWSCVVRASYNECIEAVSEQVVELVSLDPGWMYYAFYFKKMKLVLYEREPYNYLPNAVVVVTADLCNKMAKNKRHPDLQMRDLKGLRACLPGYRWAAGWNLPGKYLIDNELVVPKNRDPSLRNDIELFNQFFDKICMPSQVQGASVCSGCTDQCTIAAGQRGVYEGYPGAFRCLMEGKGDVAFLREGIVRQYASTGNAWRAEHNASWAIRPASDFRFLCPSGGCRNIIDGASGCALGVIRTRGIMINNNLDGVMAAAITAALLNASKFNDDFKEKVEVGANIDEFLFSSSMVDISLWPNLTRQYLQPADGSVDLVTPWERLEGLNNLTLSSGAAGGGVSLLFLILQLAMIALPYALVRPLP